MEPEKIRIDRKDQRILYELDSDARQPISRIAKKLGLSPEVANYRIKKLEDRGMVARYQIVTDLAKLGIIPFKICLSLQHMTSAKLQGIIEDLKKVPEVKWIVSCKGSWDMIVSAEVYSLQELETIKLRILARFEGSIYKKSLAIALDAYMCNRDYLTENPSPSRPKLLVGRGPAMDQDKTDLRIIRILADNARRPAVEIAREIGTTPRTVAYRIGELKRKQIITGFKISPGYQELGIHFHKILIYLDNIRDERVGALMRYMRTQRNTVVFNRALGNWDAEAEIETFSEDEFNDIMAYIKDTFSDIIKNIEVITISKEHKLELF